MGKTCTLDGRRVCSNSCIAYEPGGGCRAAGVSRSGFSDSDDLGLKEV